MKRILLSPDAAGNEGGGAVTGTVDTGIDTGKDVFTEGAPPEGASPEGGGGDPEVKEPTGLSKEDITQILKDAGLGEKAAPAAPADKREPPTQEELEKLFNVWKPSSELIAQLRAEKPEDAIAALTAIRDGVLKQAMTMADYRIQQLIKNLQDEHIAPLQGFVSEQQARSFHDDFFEKFPDLASYESLVDAVAAKLEKGGYKGDSREAVMEKFAAETNAVIKTLTKGGDGGAGGTGGDKTNLASKGADKQRKMSTLTGGGQGPGTKGAGGGATNVTPNVKAGLDVFN